MKAFKLEETQPPTRSKLKQTLIACQRFYHFPVASVIAHHKLSFIAIERLASMKGYIYGVDYMIPITKDKI